MYLCELYNITIGIPAVNYKRWIFTEDSKTIKGFLGKRLQSYIKSRNSYPYSCKIKNFFKLGDKLKNGSYDGALGAIDKKEIDMFLRAEIPFTNNQNVHLSYPVYTQEFYIYQLINRKELDVSDFKLHLIKSFNFEYLIYYLFSIFLFFLIFQIFLLVLIDNLLTNQFKKMKLFKKFFYFISFFDKLSNKRIKYFSLIFLGLSWFNFFTKQIMTNNIKTSKVIVDTSELITTNEKLFQSSLKAVWLEGESDLLIAKNALNNTFLNKFHINKNENPIKILSKKSIINMVLTMKNHFYFMKSSSLLIIIGLFSPFLNEDSFYNEKPFYSVFSAFYITKNIHKKKINLIFDFTQLTTQAGLVLKFMKYLKGFKLFNEPRKKKVYNNLKSYIDDFTKFDSLKYENFHYFLLIFFIFNFLIIILFFINSLFIEIKEKKNLKNINKSKFLL